MTLFEGTDEAPDRRCARCGGRERRLHAEAADSGDSQAGDGYAKAEWRCPTCRVVRVEFSTSTWVSATASVIDADDA